MADQQARNLQYNYQQNSNLVLQVDRQLVDKRGRNEATGEVKSLANRMGGTKMGDRASRMGNKEKEELEEMKKKKVLCSSLTYRLTFISGRKRRQTEEERRSEELDFDVWPRRRNL